MSWGGGKSSGPGVKLDRDPGLGGDWKKNPDTHKMSPDQVKAAGVGSSRRPPGHGPGEVLHQRSRLPFSIPAMMLAGFAIVGVIGYGVLYSKKKAEVDALDVAKVATNTATPENTEPRPRK